MKNEIYLWIALFVIIAVAALWYRFYYTASYQLTVSFNRTSLSNSIYPYQNVVMPIVVSNTGGSAISNLDFGLYMNGSLKNTYKLDIPVGKSAVIPFNYTPTTAGTYNVLVVADPGKVFDISDRQQAQANASFTVLNSEAPAPYEYINGNGLVSGSYSTLGTTGIITDSYLYTNYTFSKAAFSNISALNNLLYPITDIAGAYINEMAYSNGYYGGDNSISSIWIKSYIEPSAFAYAVSYKGLQHHNFSVNGTSVLFAKLSNSSTMCSWYSGGWIKIIGTNGTANCTSVVKSPASLHYEPVLSGMAFANNTIASNATSIGNYSEFVGNVFTQGRMLELNDSVDYIQVSTNLTNPFLVCYGAIYNISDVYLCSTYNLNSAGKIGNYSFVTTRAYLGSLNYTAYSLSATSDILRSVPEAISIIQAASYKNRAKSLQFLPGINSNCGFVEGFNCTDISFINSTVHFKIRNLYNSSVSLTSGSCFAEAPSHLFQNMSYVLGHNESANVSIGCSYYNGTRIYGVPFNLYLGLTVNYTLNKTRSQANGSAYIV
ncbi:MAG: hypothetical protein M1520_00025 [Candidatus Marsarchaeota archaeon]|jgi:hypothetical protein|nr:hypothetical protein [Candidatus Marsarchaeota archaeon]